MVRFYFFLVLGNSEPGNRLPPRKYAAGCRVYWMIVKTDNKQSSIPPVCITEQNVRVMSMVFLSDRLGFAVLRCIQDE